MTDRAGASAGAQRAGAAFQAALSAWNARFLQTAAGDRRYREQRYAARSFQGLASHAWPTFVDTARIQEWARVAISLRGLILNRGLRLIPEDGRGIADLFGYPAERASRIARLLARRRLKDAFASRADFLVSGAGLKCCEFDFGDVGLWHIVTFDAMFRRSALVEEFVARSGVRVRQRHPLGTMVAELLKLVGRRGPVRECNFCILVPEDAPAAAFEASRLEAAYACSLYQEALRTFGLQGEIVLERAGRLSFAGDRAAIDGRPIHVVMTQTPDFAAEDRLWAESPLLELVERGCVVAVNGPDCYAISNKIVLALLSEAADTGGLDGQEAALVRSAVPWTRRVVASEVTFRGRPRWLPELLASNRDELVLKPGEGVASGGVHIGRNSAPPDWQRVIDTALAQGGWVVQEAVGGIPMWLLGEDEGLAPYGVNIGITVCGDEYVGAFLRLVPVASPEEMTTIGYSHGALTGGVIEVEA
jgi:hypothetical protein